MKRYGAVDGSHLTAEDAEKIGNYLASNFGEAITPEVILEDARHVRSPLHSYFEWNDSIAAEKYRREQAGYLLRSIVIVTDDNKPIRAYHNVTIEKGGSAYVSYETALNAPELWEQVVDKAKQEALNWADRYHQYKELKPIVKIIYKTIRKEPHSENKNNRKGRTVKNTTNSAKSSKDNARRNNAIIG